MKKVVREKVRLDRSQVRGRNGGITRGGSLINIDCWEGERKEVNLSVLGFPLLIEIKGLLI